MPTVFTQSHPLFVFIDPFGPTDVPFTVVSELLGSPRSEVLINFDADGIARIIRAGARSGHEAILSRIYRSDRWRSELDPELPFSEQCRRAVDIYRGDLRSIPSVRYTFAFEMRTSATASNYFLVFASQHALGLTKMKEAMKKLDQTGSYRFCDAHVGRTTLFRFDQPEDFVAEFLHRFEGRIGVTYSELEDFALNETPFLNPKSMLKILEVRRAITVVTKDPKRRKGTFNEEKIESISFAGDETHG